MAISIFNLESSILSFHVVKTLIAGPPSEYSLKLGFTRSLSVVLGRWQTHIIIILLDFWIANTKEGDTY